MVLQDLLDLRVRQVQQVQQVLLDLVVLDQRDLLVLRVLLDPLVLLDLQVVVGQKQTMISLFSLYKILTRLCGWIQTILEIALTSLRVAA